MTFEQLKYFVQAYQLRSISLAADTLFISRQVLSRSISNLEKELNTQLFARSVSGITPTETGELFYVSAKKILEEQSYIVEKINPAIDNKNTGVKQKEKIYIGFPPAAITNTGEDFITSISNAFPDVSFNLRGLFQTNNADYYHKNDISIITLWNPISRIVIPKDKYKIEFLIKKNLYIWISPDHPLNQITTPITLEMLRKYPYCILRNTQNIDFNAEIYPDSEPNENLIVDTQHMLRQLIRDENYYTTDCFIANRFIYQDILSEKDFVIKKIEPAAYRYIIYRKEINYGFINFIKEYTKNNNFA